MNILNKTEIASTVFQVLTIALIGVLTVAEFITIVASNA